MNYNSTLPDTPQKAAIIARARQLTDFKWTPVRDVPTFTLEAGNFVFPAGIEVVGFPYSSTERTDKFLTENVSFEAFLSAVTNPYSKIYQAGMGAFNSCNYGIVCNGLVRYALGIKRRVSTLCCPTIPGMRCIAKKGEYSTNDIELCDMLYVVNENRSNHIAIITDIFKDDNNETVGIEVSEACRPVCIRYSFSNKDFLEKYKLFALWRYDYLNDVPLLDEHEDNLIKNNPYNKQPNIAVDNGDKSNYLEGEKIIISAKTENVDTINVFKDGEKAEEIKFDKKALIARDFTKGYYTLTLEKTGESVEFCVNKAKLEHEVKNGEITVYADPCDRRSEILYMDFRIEGNGYGWASLAKYEELTDEEKKTGVFKRKIPDNGKNFKVYFKNKYGVWVHRMTAI